MSATTVFPNRRLLELRTTEVAERYYHGWILVGALTAFVLFVSVNDVYWSFKTQMTLLENERNPVGRWLIRLDHGDIALFMTAKMVGTMIVVAAIPLVYWFHCRIGLLVAGFVSGFQFLLFLQLNWQIPVLAWL